MVERTVQTESISEFAQTWSLATQAFIEDSCTTRASVYAYKGDLKNLYQFLQERNVDSWEEIKPGDLLDFFERPQIKSPQKYSPASKDRQVEVVRGFFEWIKVNTKYPVKPQITETMSSIKWHPENRRRCTATKLLSRSELTSIAANPDSRNQALIRLLIAGIRPTQLEKLTIGDIEGNIADPRESLRIRVPRIENHQVKQVEIMLNDETGLALRQHLVQREVDLTNLSEPLFGITRQRMWAITSNWGGKIGVPCNPRLLARSARRFTK